MPKPDELTSVLRPSRATTFRERGRGLNKRRHGHEANFVDAGTAWLVAHEREAKEAAEREAVAAATNMANH